MCNQLFLNTFISLIILSYEATDSSSLLYTGGDDLNKEIGKFNSTGKIGLLINHNSLRSKISLGHYVVANTQLTKPKSSNMYKLIWNNTLEKSAQSWADRCVFAHSNTIGLGENLYTKYSSAEFSLDQTIGIDASQAWADEFVKYGWPIITLTIDLFNSGVGHATQQVWASTRSIGCGVSMCNNNTQVIVVCHYYPPGNYIGEPIYRIGKICSACPIGSSCDNITALCT